MPLYYSTASTVQQEYVIKRKQLFRFFFISHSHSTNDLAPEFSILNQVQRRINPLPSPLLRTSITFPVPWKLPFLSCSYSRISVCTRISYPLLYPLSLLHSHHNFDVSLKKNWISFTRFALKIRVPSLWNFSFNCYELVNSPIVCFWFRAWDRSAMSFPKFRSPICTFRNLQLQSRWQSLPL